jgi:hypothetical protein
MCLPGNLPSEGFAKGKWIKLNINTQKIELEPLQYLKTIVILIMAIYWVELLIVGL